VAQRSGAFEVPAAAVGIEGELMAAARGEMQPGPFRRRRWRGQTILQRDRGFEESGRLFPRAHVVGAPSGGGGDRGGRVGIRSQAREHEVARDEEQGRAALRWPEYARDVGVGPGAGDRSHALQAAFLRKRMGEAQLARVVGEHARQTGFVDRGDHGLEVPGPEAHQHVDRQIGNEQRGPLQHVDATR
jgi:hypothetical protein